MEWRAAARFVSSTLSFCFVSSTPRELSRNFDRLHLRERSRANIRRFGVRRLARLGRVGIVAQSRIGGGCGSELGI